MDIEAFDWNNKIEAAGLYWEKFSPPVHRFVAAGGIPVENAMRKERRLGNRKALNGLLPGRLQTPSGVDLVCKPVDISPHGIGILMDRELAAGNALQLIMKDRTIDLTVAWVQHDFHKEELFRYGLITINMDLDLERIFLDAGCLK